MLLKASGDEDAIRINKRATVLSLDIDKKVQFGIIV